MFSRYGSSSKKTNKQTCNTSEHNHALGLQLTEYYQQNSRQSSFSEIVYSHTDFFCVLQPTQIDYTSGFFGSYPIVETLVKSLPQHKYMVLTCDRRKRRTFCLLWTTARNTNDLRSEST